MTLRRTIAVFGCAGALAGCGSTVTHRSTIPFSRGKIELVVTSVGGALGEERYELFYGDEGQRFFAGSNFSEFNVAERDGKLMVQMCKGLIDHAEPIALRKRDNVSVFRLTINWNCLDKRHEV